MANLSTLIGGVSTLVVNGGSSTDPNTGITTAVDTTIQMNIQVVTELPDITDANTLYLIRA